MCETFAPVNNIAEAFGQARSTALDYLPAAPGPLQRVRSEHRHTAQSHVCVGVTALPRDHVDQWTLDTVSEVNLEGSHVSRNLLLRKPWVSGIKPELLESAVTRPPYLSISVLWDQMKYLRSNGLDDKVYKSAFWEKIFYPFFTTKQSGSGVGLATAQKIVAGHGGVLELGSEAGRGCSFRVRVPIEDEKP